MTTYAAANQPLSSINYGTINGLQFDARNARDHTPSSHISSGSYQTTSWNSATTVFCKMGSATTAFCKMGLATTAFAETARNRELWVQSTSVMCGVGDGGLPSIFGYPAVTVGTVWTGQPVFSFDAAVASDMQLNTPHSVRGSVTMGGLSTHTHMVAAIQCATQMMQGRSLCTVMPTTCTDGCMRVLRVSQHSSYSAVACDQLLHFLVLAGCMFRLVTGDNLSNESIWVDVAPCV